MLLCLCIPKDHNKVSVYSNNTFIDLSYQYKYIVKSDLWSTYHSTDIIYCL